jgi:hypothetical protein
LGVSYFISAALGIPKVEVRKFKLFAALTLDFIWRARNQLVHEGIQPSPSKAIIQISLNLNNHISARRDLALPSMWMPSAVGCFKANFDVAIRASFAMAATVISNDMGIILAAAIHKLSSTDVLRGEAFAALLVVRLTASLSLGCLSLEGDALLVVLAVNNLPLFHSWSFVNCILNIGLALSSFQSWSALKISRCANFRAHALAKWAIFNHVFGSIPTGPPILSSIRIRNEKNLPL